MIKYKILGNGGAFDYNQCNSSFLIGQNEEYLLFDCGYSVFAELRKQDADININLDLKKLTTVYISHMDDDHIGSLKALIYYQYFINNIKIQVTCHSNLIPSLLEYLSDINYSMVDGINTETDIVRVNNIPSWNKLRLNKTPTNHGKPCFGLVIESKDSALFITGDTKATTKIRHIIDNLHNSYPKVKVFHDYSNWDCEPSQVHACLTDITELYSDTTRSRYTKYHTGEPFNSNWQII